MDVALISPEVFGGLAVAAVAQPITKERILASERIRSRFDIGHIANRYIELYERLNNGHAPRIR